jgi:putative two-component system response regulator
MFKPTMHLAHKDFLDIAMRFAYIAELAEWDNRNHLVRMRRYMYLLGMKLDLPMELVGSISVASVLHDVGKVNTPAELLLRQGEFSSQEWKVIERHTIDGAEILADAHHPILQMAEKIAFTHHERWDGSGYPQRIKGKQIPIEGRMCAVADVFDALTTDRSYKKGIDLEAGFSLMEEASGQLFDPDIVQVFLSSIDEITKIHQSISS